MRDGKLMYPIMGVGSFFILFWFGVSTAYALDLNGLTILAVGLIAGCAGASLVAQLERLDRGS